MRNLLGIFILIGYYLAYINIHSGSRINHAIGLVLLFVCVLGTVTMFRRN